MMNAREFTKIMEEIAAGPGQRLVGDISTGYQLLDDNEVKLRNLTSSVAKKMLNDRIGVPETFTYMPEIRKVIFNYPATVVIWSDGTKTIVKCGDYDIYDPEKGMAMAIAKKALGGRGNYYNEFKKWLPEETNIDISEESYVEKDTECDLCEHKEECDLIEITNCYDTRIHLAPGIGNRCKKKEGAPYTVKEFCELLNISKATVYRMIERGVVKAEKDSKGVWIIYE